MKTIQRNVLISLSIMSFSVVGHTRATTTLDAEYISSGTTITTIEPTPLENITYKSPSTLTTNDLSWEAQKTISPVLLMPNGTTLKSAEAITSVIKLPVTDPRFGLINPPLQRLVNGQLVAAPDLNLNSVARNITVYDASLNPNPILIPTVSGIVEPIVPSVVAPTLGNGGLISGSRLSMSIASTANPFSEIPVMTTTTRSTQDALKLNIHATCFPANLRSVSNGVSPRAILTLHGKYSITGSPSIASQDFEVSFPASAVMLGTGTNLTLTYQDDFKFIGFPNAATGAVSGHLVSINLPSVTNASLNVNTGTISQAHSSFQISDLYYTQALPTLTQAEIDELASPANYQAAAATYLAQTGNQYWVTLQDWQNNIVNYGGQPGVVGYAGPLNNQFYNASNSAAAMNLSQSSDGKVITLSSSLPGDGFMCGGFYSPLMVFFDKDRPKFENVTDFKMKHNEKTYWPEKDHAGYFLGLLNKNGKIESHKDLFGEAENIANGFESLSQYDLNKDGLIDSKDAIFKKLVLWKDKSGLGRFDKKDMVYAHKKIKSIQLKYSNNFEMVSIGAEYRQRSTFEFVKNGKVQKGEIVDVWFKPYLEKMDRKMAINEK